MVNPRIDTTTLRYFVRVIEETTIAGAAEREHITAAAVSKRISDLEDCLGINLLLRNNKGVVPTGAGAELLLLARRVLNELDQIPEQMRRYQSGVRGLVRIIVSTSATTQHFPAHINNFLHAYPDVQVQIEETTSAMAIQAVVENSADIAIFVNCATQLESYPYGGDRLVVVVPPTHELAHNESINLAQALDYDYIGFSRDGALHHAVARASAEAEKSIRQRVQVHTFESLSIMVSQGLGFAVMPEPVARRHMRTFDIHAIHLRDPWASREFRLGVRSKSALQLAAKLVLEHLSQQQ